MNPPEGRFMCADCKYAVWPIGSLGECHHPEIANSLTMEARNPDGVCGPLGKLWEKKNETSFEFNETKA